MEQILAAQFKCGGVVIGATEANIMARTTVTVFEVLEKAWASVDCSLIDMKIEFGVDMATGEHLANPWTIRSTRNRLIDLLFYLVFPEKYNSQRS